MKGLEKHRYRSLLCCWQDNWKVSVIHGWPKHDCFSACSGLWEQIYALGYRGTFTRANTGVECIKGAKGFCWYKLFFQAEPVSPPWTRQSDWLYHFLYSCTEPHIDYINGHFPQHFLNLPPGRCTKTADKVLNTTGKLHDIQVHELKAYIAFYILLSCNDFPLYVAKVEVIWHYYTVRKPVRVDGWAHKFCEFVTVVCTASCLYQSILLFKYKTTLSKQVFFWWQVNKHLYKLVLERLCISRHWLFVFLVLYGNYPSYNYIEKHLKNIT